MSLKRLLVIVTVLAFTPAIAQTGQTFEKGLAAYNSGDFGSAFAQWWPLSLRGQAKAQTGLGFLYYRGLGVPQDDIAAALWFSRAADKGEPVAQFFMGLFSLQGRAVERDYARARMWCDLAMSGGYSDASECSDEAALHMSHAEFLRSNALLEAWRRKADTAGQR